MADKTVVKERENQCKAEIKETSSAQCPMSLKGRRPHAPRGSTVPLQNNSEGASSRLKRVRSYVASSRVWSGQQNRRFPNPSRGTRSVPPCTQYGCSRPWSTIERAVKKGAQGQHLCCTEAMMRRRGQRRCRPSFNLRGLSESRQVTLEKPFFAADNLAKLLGGA